MKILGYLFVTNVAMLLMTMASCAGQDKTSEPLRQPGGQRHNGVCDWDGEVTGESA